MMLASANATDRLLRDAVLRFYNVAGDLEVGRMTPQDARLVIDSLGPHWPPAVRTVAVRRLLAIFGHLEETGPSEEGPSAELTAAHFQPPPLSSPRARIRPHSLLERPPPNQNAKFKARTDVCPRGHPRTNENTIWHPPSRSHATGHIECRLCKAEGNKLQRTRERTAMAALADLRPLVDIVISAYQAVPPTARCGSHDALYAALDRLAEQQVTWGEGQ